MKKYAIECLQGTSMWDYTFEEPLSRKEIIEKFYEYVWIEDMGFLKRDLTLKFIKDVWEVEFIKIKGDELNEKC